MESDKIELAERAVACKGWRWMPGMATVQGERVVLMDDDGTLRLAAPWGGTVGVTAVLSFFDSSGACLPDLTDPATLGCLLALVREAHEEKTAHTRPFKGRWLVERETRPYLHEWLCSCGTWGEGEGHVVGGDTEAEALVAALEAAP